MNQTPNMREVAVGTINKILGIKDFLVPSKMFKSLYDDLVENYEVQYFWQGSFTAALLVDRESRNVEFVGISKQNPIDPLIPLRGRALALSRAIRALVDARLSAPDDQPASVPGSKSQKKEKAKKENEAVHFFGDLAPRLSEEENNEWLSWINRTHPESDHTDNPE